jgi:hypothetical protein
MTKSSSIDDLVAEARATRAALDEYVRRRKQLNVIEMFGKIDYDENFDYKLERERKPTRR